MTKPFVLSPELNSKILRFAPKHSVSDIAPDTFQRLKSQSTASIVVWSGGSTNTIYGDANVNYAFRAWHDALHLSLNAEFTLQGEIQVALEQCRLIKDDGLARIIVAEVIGQAELFYKSGLFPVDQVEFVKQYLKVS